jgi:D-3-phosphoglycerate dehydrogenase/C-terminal binding protein
MTPPASTETLMPLTLLFSDSRAEALDLEREITGPDTVLLHCRNTQRRFDAIAPDVWASADAIVTSRVPIDAAAVPHLTRAKIIVRNGVGFDIIDLQACGEAGIAVCNVPDYGTTEVADTAIAMMLAFARGTAAYDAALRAGLEGGWTHLHNVTARRLRGACFGVVGFGRIGTAAALRASAFGMDVAFYDPLLPNGSELPFGYTRTRRLADLLAMADVISIHAPLTPETRRMIDENAVAAIKPGAYLINPARGPICDTAALSEGLKSGRLAAVGLDVLPKEPGSTADPLVAAWQANEPWIRGRVLLSPHSGFFSPDSFIDMRRKAAETAYYYLTEGKLANCVNAEYLKNPRH